MNKIAVILGIIALITLGGLFFCAGFFTGSSVYPNLLGESPKNFMDIGNLLEEQSVALNNKLKDIADFDEPRTSKYANEKISIDSLLREIASTHSAKDDCSIDKTAQSIQLNESLLANKTSNSFEGKALVFIGYFKNKIALQVQRLLMKKGYKAHVEISKNQQNESFVFCGPFKKEINAAKLAKWLSKHGFAEARVVSISNEAIEETLYDFMNDDSLLPENEERDIPEIDLAQEPFEEEPNNVLLQNKTNQINARAQQLKKLQEQADALDNFSGGGESPLV